MVGGGVSGLSTGIRMLESGFEVELRAREPGLSATSGVAAAVWYPYKVGPIEAAAAWSRSSYDVFRDIAADPASGVLLRSALELLPREGMTAAWRNDLDGLRRAGAGELRPGHADGYLFEVPVIEMPVYLPWLEARFRRAGGRLLRASVSDLDELGGACDLVVDCAGLGARELASDPALVPVRGQVLRVARGELERVTFDDHNPAGVSYVVPRSADCVLGGSAAEGRSDLEPDAGETAGILERCRALEPRLAGCEVLEVRVGLRPFRPEVRLELERSGPTPVLHNYGHGGAGVTLSWGCAEDALALACAALGDPTGRPERV